MNGRRWLAVVFALIPAAAPAVDAPRAPPAAPPPGVLEISIRNTIDGVAEPVWFLPNPSADPAPWIRVGSI